MKKLLIVPAIIALAFLSGSAFAQTTVIGIIGVGNPTTATNSPVNNVAPVFVQAGVAAAANVGGGIQDAAAFNSNSAIAGIGNVTSGAIIIQ